jgi:nucleotide-binding universal stress UspA family protein
MMGLKSKPSQVRTEKPLFEDSENVVCAKGGKPVDLELEPGGRVKRILVPTDFSPCSDVAVTRAVEIALRCNAMLTILHVIDINSPAAARYSGTADALMKGLWDRGLSALCNLTKHLADSKIKNQTRVVEGLPAEAIIETSAGYDLLVIGRQHSRSPWRLFSRHTAQRVIESAKCPVLVVDHEPGFLQDTFVPKSTAEV